jgi:hypothetical protein
MRKKPVSIPRIVDFFTFWFGSEKTDWEGIRREWGLSKDQMEELKLNNKKLREYDGYY